MGIRRPRSGPKVALDIQDTVWEYNFGNTKSTELATVGSGRSKCGLGVVFWEQKEHEVAYSLPRTLKILPGSCVLARCVIIPDKSYTRFEVTIFLLLAWLHRNDDESHDAR